MKGISNEMDEKVEEHTKKDTDDNERRESCTPRTHRKEKLGPRIRRVCSEKERKNESERYM